MWHLWRLTGVDTWQGSPAESRWQTDDRDECTEGTAWLSQGDRSWWQWQDVSVTKPTASAWGGESRFDQQQQRGDHFSNHSYLPCLIYQYIVQFHYHLSYYTFFSTMCSTIFLTILSAVYWNNSYHSFHTVLWNNFSYSSFIKVFSKPFIITFFILFITSVVFIVYWFHISVCIILHYQCSSDIFWVSGASFLVFCYRQMTD